MKVYCFDLDGTLCTKEDDYHNAKPLKERIRKINQLYDEGNTILIDTARGSMTGIDHTQYIEFQLKRWGVKYHKVRAGVKLFANVYVDDSGVNDRDFFND